MTTKLYKNTEGKVLMSVGNKLIKQPYEFGLAFQNRMGLKNYLQISNISISQYGTILTTSTNFIPATYAQVVFNCQNSNNDNYSYWSETAGADLLKYLKNYGGANQATNTIAHINSAVKKIIIGCVTRVTSINSIINGDNTLTSTTSTQTNTLPITKIWVGALRSSNGILPSEYSNSSIKHNRFVMYSRELSLSEIRYYYNNSLGNDLQSTTGIEIDLHCNKAEILDFSLLQDGSDMRVGCRDYSGFNRHGEIMNLPAGTLQQKLDYANANLFVSFQ